MMDKETASRIRRLELRVRLQTIVLLCITALLIGERVFPHLLSMIPLAIVVIVGCLCWSKRFRVYAPRAVYRLALTVRGIFS